MSTELQDPEKNTIFDKIDDTISSIKEQIALYEQKNDELEKENAGFQKMYHETKAHITQTLLANQGALLALQGLREDTTQEASQ